MPKFRFIPDIAIADSAFEAYGKDLNELLENAALATYTEMVDLKTVSPKSKKEVSLESDSKEKLLYNFLSEIIFLKDTEQFLAAKIKCEIQESGACLPDGACNEKLSLKATLAGEKINMKKHKLGNDVKAVTWHQFSITEGKAGYTARVVLDI